MFKIGDIVILKSDIKDNYNTAYKDLIFQVIKFHDDNKGMRLKHKRSRVKVHSELDVYIHNFRLATDVEKILYEF